MLLAPAHAEGTLRIAQQYGIVYLILDVAKDQQFIEKEGRKAGVDIQTQWQSLSGGAAINDALLAGATDIASAGTGPLYTIWDKTYGHQNVRGIASLGNIPDQLISIDPKVETIADLTSKDRIAVPAVGVSVQSRFLQWAAAKQWGDANYQRLEPLTQALPHPDATAAIISGKTEINAHFSVPPFQEQELAQNKAAHVILDSYEVSGGPSSATVLYTTEAFRNKNPKTYHAFIAALQDAVNYIHTDPKGAVQAYIRIEHSTLDPEVLLKIVTDPRTEFKIDPQNTLGLAQFMYRVKAIKHEPKSWKDYFFADPLVSSGS